MTNVEEAAIITVKSEAEFDGSLIRHEEPLTSCPAPPGWEFQQNHIQESEENRSSNALSTGQSSTSILEQAQSPTEDTSFSGTPLCPAPLCRQFWKAGNYEDSFASKSHVPSSQNYLHVHPKFLHSNATSHKWAFGAIAELLDNAIDEFDDIGPHGTKVIVYNLWYTNDGTLEFDFESDPEDIRLHDSKVKEKSKSNMLISEEHIGSRYRYSLRVYLSILYLRIPPNFSMILRGKIVEHHLIAHDLKYPEFILYKPQIGGAKEEVITTIGFLKEAPHVYLHGFNVYHKNRLILPFWHVVSYSDSRGRGVVGILEANFVEPTHNKQDFERTSLFQKLETRLKEMTWEYWDFHCGLIGYQVKKKGPAPVSLPDSSQGGPENARHILFSVNNSGRSGRAGPIVQNIQASSRLHGVKRKQEDSVSALGKGRRQARDGPDTTGHSTEAQPVVCASNALDQEESYVVVIENKRLRAKCLEYEKSEEELSHKLSELNRELKELQDGYARMLKELESLDEVKPEKDGV